MPFQEIIISLGMSSSLEIINSTEYVVTGEVSFLTAFLVNQSFFLTPHNIQTTKKRMMPVTEITASVRTPRGIFYVKTSFPFGTYHQSFEIVQLRENIFTIDKKIFP